MKYNNLDTSITPPAGFAELVRRVEALRCREGRAFVAIDGRCGSGKSTLAALLAARFDCTLVHADDFFLRPEQRTPARLAQPGGNFDRERFYAEVLAPLLAGRDALYRPYDCHAGALQPPVAAPLRPVVLAEGSYSCHPDLWGSAAGAAVPPPRRRPRGFPQPLDPAGRGVFRRITARNALRSDPAQRSVLQTQDAIVQKVPTGRHVRTVGTHTGKLSAESVRGSLGRVRGSALNFVPRGIPGGRNF